MKSLPIVVVTWLDAITTNGWEDADQVHNDPEPIYTVGFLIASDRKAITVASTADRWRKGCNARITIPRGMVVSIVRVRVPTEKDPDARPSTHPRTAKRNR